MNELNWNVLQRWGDAPVHSIAASLFLPKDRIHFFDNIGYSHDSFAHCPIGEDTWNAGRCGCDQEKSFGIFLEPHLQALISLHVTPLSRLHLLVLQEKMGRHHRSSVNRAEIKWTLDRVWLPCCPAGQASASGRVDRICMYTYCFRLLDFQLFRISFRRPISKLTAWVVTLA
jgi:hypothetical protein